MSIHGRVFQRPPFDDFERRNPLPPLSLGLGLQSKGGVFGLDFEAKSALLLSRGAHATEQNSNLFGLFNGSPAKALRQPAEYPVLDIEPPSNPHRLRWLAGHCLLKQPPLFSCGFHWKFFGRT